jgi:uncharacterized iron-regulated protein
MKTHFNEEAMMQKARRPVKQALILILAGLCLSCSTANQKIATTANALPGEIWDVSAGRTIDTEKLLHRLAAARLVLLGETHDNPDHHRIQAGILQSMVYSGRRPALVMEQFDLAQQVAIDTILESNASAAQKVRRLSETMGKGWDQSGYKPVLNVAAHASLPVIAANLSRDAARQIARNGFDALGKPSIARLMLEPVWTVPRESVMTKAIQDGHCGMLPPEAVEGMAKAQRARDAIMADRLLQHGTRGAVAIFGRGHVMKTVGVPLYLAARGAGKGTVTIGILESNDSINPAKGMHEALHANYDYVWFTPPIARTEDPCKAFRPPALTAPIGNS